MINKKMTKDEAEKAAKEWSKNYTTPSHYILRGNEYRVQILGDNRPESSQAIFPFEPPHPECVIGDKYRFWSNGSDDWMIGPLSEVDRSNFGLPFKVANRWFQHAEPYTLIDPAEHAQLRRENMQLSGDTAKLRAGMDRLRREVERLQDETIDPEEHAKAKEAEAVLAELFPVCEEIIEQHGQTVWPMSEPIERLEKLLK